MIPNQALYAANLTDGEVLKTVMNDTLKVCAASSPPDCFTLELLHLASPSRSL